jgi:hypothetical protein
VADPAAFPEIPGFTETPDGGTAALIPADAWKRAFTWAKKLTAKLRSDNPALRSVAVRIGASETAFAAANDDYPWFESTPNLTGRFAPYEDIIRGLGSNMGKDRLAVDPEYLATVLRTANEVSRVGREFPEAEVETHGDSRPLVVRAGRPDGVQFFSMLMPLVPDRTRTEPAPIGSEADRLAALERAYAELVDDRAALAVRVAVLEAALARAQTAGPTRPT